MKIPVFLISLLLMAPVVSAQMARPAPVMTGPSLFSQGARPPVIDLSRLDLHHSYSLSWMSGGGRSVSGGEYTGTMLYQFNSPVWLRMDVGVMHDPFGSQAAAYSGSAAQVYLKNLSLTWKPSASTTVQFGYHQIPAGYAGWWDRPFGYSRFGSSWLHDSPWNGF